MAANYAFVLALSMTAASSALVLEQSATVFVFFGSVVILKDERITVFKLVAVVVCIAGVVCVAFGDESNSNQRDSQSKTIAGDLIAVGSALFSACYMVGQKRFLAGIDSLQLLWFLNFLSSWVLLVYWIALLLLHVTGVELISSPSGLASCMLTVGALMSFGFNLAVNRALLVASPLFVRLCVIATLPISFVVDLLRTGALHFLKLGGVCLVGIGFVGYVFMLHREALTNIDTAVYDDCDVSTSALPNLESAHPLLQ
jgi:drug/metabolite transporter (DMT)-like permease